MPSRGVKSGTWYCKLPCAGNYALRPDITGHAARNEEVASSISHLACWRLGACSVGTFWCESVFFVGIPAMLVASGIAGGARLPWKIPLRDTLAYIAISVATVIAVIVYAYLTK